MDLDCTTHSDRDYIDGQIDVRPLAGMQISTVKATEQIVSRRKSSIGSATNEDWYLVSLQSRGSCIVTQDGRATRITNGGMALYDTLRPYSLELETDFEQIVLQFSRETFERHVPNADSLTARSLQGTHSANTALLAAVRSLATNIDSLNADAAHSMAQGIEHLVFAGVHSLTTPPADRHLETRRDAIKRYLIENLDDPTLSVNSVSKALHLSPSSVHRAFSQEGETIMTWVWNRRLDRIHRELVSGRAAHVTLSQLALSRGFSDSAHFSRAFRAKFGVAPSQMRAIL